MVHCAHLSLLAVTFSPCNFHICVCFIPVYNFLLFPTLYCFFMLKCSHFSTHPSIPALSFTSLFIAYRQSYIHSEILFSIWLLLLLLFLKVLSIFFPLSLFCQQEFNFEHNSSMKHSNILCPVLNPSSARSSKNAL